MRVAITCPAPRGSRLGNRVTALRWGSLLRDLGHDAFVSSAEVPSRGYDALVALHARHSAEAIRESRARHPKRPIALVLTGTDLYRDVLVDADARRSLDLADLLVVLHPLGARALPPRHRGKTRFVPQSAEPLRAPKSSRAAHFQVAVVAHLREEKDPLRTALAARLLPARSRILVVHAGRALSPELERQAIAESATNPRYRWIGELSPHAARALIASSQLLSLSSRMEGGANVLSEAIVDGVPVVASRIDCTRALLGEDYPALYRVGATAALARLLSRAERDAPFLDDLARRCRARRAIVSVAAERAALRALMRELARAAP